MKRLTDRGTAEVLKRNAEGLMSKGFDVPIDDLRYIKLADYENEEERKECFFVNDNTCVCCGEQIPEGRQICPKCEKGDDASMTLDEAIKHCLEVAERNETSAITYKNCKEFKTNMYEKLTAEKAESDCRECAADHRQLAEWLTDYKKLRSIVDACNILAVDAFAVEKLCKELKEAKRLLKAAVEGFNLLGNYLDDNCPINVNCIICPLHRDINCKCWKHKDEALTLIGKDTNVPAREESEDNA